MNLFPQKMKVLQSMLCAMKKRTAMTLLQHIFKNTFTSTAPLFTMSIWIRRSIVMIRMMRLL